MVFILYYKIPAMTSFGLVFILYLLKLPYFVPIVPFISKLLSVLQQFLLWFLQNTDLSWNKGEITNGEV